VTVDGNDVEAVDTAAAALVADVRAGRGPRLLHAITYRVKGHVSVDPATYRDPLAHQAALADDPIARARARLAGLGVAEDALRAIEDEARAEIAAATAAAEAALPPAAPRAYTEVQDCGAGRWRS
jgi:pyruvate dehydrogenase E1 component alpha subunit